MLPVAVPSGAPRVPSSRAQTPFGVTGGADARRMAHGSQEQGLPKDGSSLPRSCRSPLTALSRVWTARSPSVPGFSNANSLSGYGGHVEDLGRKGLVGGDLLGRWGQDGRASPGERPLPPKGPRGPRIAPPGAGPALRLAGAARTGPARGPRNLSCTAGNMLPGTRSSRSIASAPIGRSPASGPPPGRAPARTATCPGLGWWQRPSAYPQGRRGSAERRWWWW